MREQRRRKVDKAVYREPKKYSDNGVEDEEKVMEMVKLNLMYKKNCLNFQLEGINLCPCIDRLE